MKKKIFGFTLIEIMIVVSVVGILLAIALPQYNNYMTKAARNDAKSAMLNIAQMEERYYSNNTTYILISALPAAAPTGFQNYSGNDPNSRKYDITVVVGSTGSIATSFLMTATPVVAGYDPQCGNLTLTSTGVKGSTTGSCW